MYLFHLLCRWNITSSIYCCTWLCRCINGTRMPGPLYLESQLIAHKVSTELHNGITCIPLTRPANRLLHQFSGAS